jgi:hypothetical protein
VKHLSILINKIEQTLRKNTRSVPLLDTMLMILVITYGIMKITKSLGVEMSYSMRRSCTKIMYNEKEMYYNYVSSRILYSERGYCERKKRKLQRVCCRLYPFILLDNK